MSGFDPSPSVLITNYRLDGYAGTEVVVRELALGLQAAGWRPMVFSPVLGAMAAGIAAAGIPVVSRLDDLPAGPDLIHGHHNLPTLAATARFPAARAIFVCHGRLPAAESPPLSPAIDRYVAVDLNCLERLTHDYGIPAGRTTVILNWVDLARFQPRAPLPAAPRRALVFSNYARLSTQLGAVQDACAAAGIRVDAVGLNVGRVEPNPERLLGDYDLVFAKGKAALEALATGAAVVLCDAQGLGPMVTSAEVERLRPWNFGMQLLREELTRENILRQIRRYDPADAAGVRDFIRSQADLRRGIEQYLGLYREVLASPPRPAVTDAVATAYEALLARTAEFERELHHWRARRHRTSLVPPEHRGALRMTTEAKPDTVTGGRTYAFRVTLRNDSDYLIGSVPPYPVFLAYRWFDDAATAVATGHPVCPLPSALPPGGERDYWMEIPAPSRPGRYTLRLTLVQERGGWFDQPPAPVHADVPLAVAPAAG